MKKMKDKDYTTASAESKDCKRTQALAFVGVMAAEGALEGSLGRC